MRMLRAAAEPSRLRLLALCAQGEFTVSELVQILNQSQPRISRHLKILCEAGFLERLSEGNWAYYRQATEPEARAAAKKAEARYMKTDGRLRRLEGLPLAVKEDTAIKGKRQTVGTGKQKNEGPVI